MTINVDNGVKPRFEVEAAPENITIHVHGERFSIDYIDEFPTNKDHGLLLFTSLPAFDELTNYGIYVVSQQLTVEAILECDDLVASPFLLSSQFLLLHYKDIDKDIDKDNAIKKGKPLFKLGDAIKLRFEGESITLKQLFRISRQLVFIDFDRQRYSLEIAEQVTISGCIKNDHKKISSDLKLAVNGTFISVKSDGTFHFPLTLVEGINKITAKLYSGVVPIDEKTLYIYRLKLVTHNQERLLWIEQGHNIVQLSQKSELERLVQLAFKANMTAFVLDIKGVEGFASFKQNHLSKRPYVSSMKAENRQGIDESHDFLASFITASHAMNIKVYAAINVFSEGSYFRGDIAVPALLKKSGQYKLNAIGDIEEHQYSKAVFNRIDKIAYLSPNNEHARLIHMQTLEDVLSNYDVDGIVLDRCRYDDELADFSESAKEQFLAYCTKHHIEVQHFPNDIMRIVDGVRIEGRLINVWWTFRSHTIFQMVQQVRERIDYYQKQKQRPIKLATYVGSWYEYAYLYGINWASPTFKKQYIFDWEQSPLYDVNYAKTSYAHLLDFIVVGLYQQTLAEIEQYLFISHYVTDERLPIISGIALPYTEEEALRISILQLAVNKSSGFMLFDHCHIKDWNALIKQLEHAQASVTSNTTENYGG